MGSRQHKLIQMGTSVVISPLLPEIKIKFLFHLMEAEGQFIVIDCYCYCIVILRKPPQ